MMRVGGLLCGSLPAAVGTPQSVHSALSGAGKQQKERDNPSHQVHYAPIPGGPGAKHSARNAQRLPANGAPAGAGCSNRCVYEIIGTPKNGTTFIPAQEAVRRSARSIAAPLRRSQGTESPATHQLHGRRCCSGRPAPATRATVGLHLGIKCTAGFCARRCGSPATGVRSASLCK